MFVRCKDIISLPSLKVLKVVAGEEGLDRTITWVYVAECFEDSREAANWLYGGELVFITGVGLKGSEELLNEFILKINKKNISGLIINVGKYIPEIPQSSINIANKLQLPLFELPWKVKLLDISTEICSSIIMKKIEGQSLNNLLENILFSDIKAEDNLLERANQYGHDLSGKNRVGIIDIDNFAEYIKEKNIKNENIITDIKNKLQRIIYDSFLENSISIVTMQKNDSIIFMFKAKDASIDWIKLIIDKININLNKKIKDLSFSTGIGKAYSDLKDMKNSYREAEESIQIIKYEKNNSNILFYEEQGLYNLLLGINNNKILEEYLWSTIGPLIESDKSNELNLVDTLECFINMNCNINLASNKLFIHKNTLRYRLQKIEEILHCDFGNMDHRVKLNMAFKVRNLL